VGCIFVKNIKAMEATIKKNFPVTGLSCASCAVSVESMLKAQKGVVDASVNYANSSAWVEYQPTINVEDFKTAIQSIGYDLLIEEEGHHHHGHQLQAKHR
jgi:Cu2+-exporting ATPase